MNTPIILLTHSYIDQIKLAHIVSRGFFDSTIEQSIQQAMTNSTSDFVFDRFDSLQHAGRIIKPAVDSKKDMMEVLADMMVVYSEPTLLFLGNIQEYSINVQQGLLTFLEEPPHNLHIIMYAHTLSTILPTVQSRSLLYPLQQALVLKLLDPVLRASVTKKLPKPSEITTLLLSGQLVADDFSSIDTKKLERNEIDMWLWQLGFNSTLVYQQNQNQKTAKILKKILLAQELNQSNTQKKFVFYSLLS